MSKSRAHERGLARARAKREAERRRAGRRRFAWIVGTAGVVIAAILLYVFVFRPDGTGPVEVADDATPATTAPTAPAADADAAVACSGTVPAAADAPKPTFEAPPTTDFDENASHRATMTTSCGDVVIELFSSRSPKTVENFIALARQEYYAGVTFHRVIEGFMIQGGDPTGTGSNDPGYTIEGERDAAEEFGYERGIVAMANVGGDPSTASTQFFIVQGPDASSLPPDYAVFGRVIEGMEVVDAIAGVPTDATDKPTSAVYIENITIETT